MLLIQPSDKLPTKLAEDLKKSGFGSELAALQTFHRAAFRTVAGNAYFDNILKCQREVDLSAEKELISSVSGGWACEAVVSVVGEVKKSEKPWVVLKSGTHENPYNIYLRDTLIWSQNIRAEHTIQEELAKDFLASREHWFGHGVHEGFKKPDVLGRWFKAASSVCRAAWSAMAAPRQPQEKLATVIVMQPLVVLDGRLFCATSGEDFQLELSEITRATLLYQETNLSFNRRFLVDLVVLKSLPSYVDELDSRLQVVHGHLMRKVAEYC